MLHNKIALDSILDEQVIQKIDFDGGAPPWVDLSVSTHGGDQAHLKDNKASKHEKKISKKISGFEKSLKPYPLFWKFFERKTRIQGVKSSDARRKNAHFMKSVV